MKPKILSTEIAHQNRWYHVRHDVLEWPNGHKGEYFVIEGWEAVGVIVVQDGKILTVTQNRYPVDQVTIEIPMGRIDQGETSEQAASRELAEEAGYAATRMIKLGTFFAMNGVCNVPFHIFLAQDLVACADSLDAEEQGLTAKWITLDEWTSLIRNNVINDADSLAAWALYSARKQ